MRIELICIAVVALAWGGYPLIARSSGMGTPLGALLMTSSSLLPIVLATIWNGVAARPSTGELTKLLIGGTLMGVGTTAFNYLANSRNIEASISIPIADTAMLIVSVVAAILFFAEPLTVKKLIGLALLIAGIAVLRPE